MSSPDPCSIAEILPPDVLDDLLCAALNRVTRLAARLHGVAAAAVGRAREGTLYFVYRAPAGCPLTLPGAETRLQGLVAAGHAFHLVVPEGDDALPGDAMLRMQGITSVAGVPVRTPQGAMVGCLCVFGRPALDGATESGLLDDLAMLAAVPAGPALNGTHADPVTGLPNRERLRLDFERRGRTPCQHAGTFALIDLARPDEVARMLRMIGGACVDELVRNDARILRDALDRRVQLYHVAPTQFAVVAPPCTDAEAFAASIGEDLLHRALQAQTLFSATSTAGLVTMTVGENDVTDLLRRAQVAVDDARRRRVAVGVYSIEQDRAHRRAFTVLNDFATALEAADQLRLVFQPRLALASGRCVGVEALLRWTHPVLGEISPGEFVPLIEQTVMARAMMRWVLEAALSQLAVWVRGGLKVQLSVNVSATNLEESDFAAHVIAALERHDIAPSVLELEVTESAMLADNSRAMHTLGTLAAAGLHLAIDDFGTGYSSLSYLHRLPADVLKIDKSFVLGLVPSARDQKRHRTLVAAMVRLGHELGYRVVAEGIETPETAELLRRMGCDEVQGFLYGRPMPPGAFLAWYAQIPLAPQPGAARRSRTAPLAVAAG